MIFTLEVLQAKHGDCLILHFGKPKSPEIIVIDGGPSGIYKGFLKPRLLEIKDTLSPEEALPLSMVMVSHLDDDHVNGILELTKDQIESNQADFVIGNLWFNTFDDIIGNNQIPEITAMGSSASVSNLAGIPILSGLPEDELAVIASTPQGRTLRDDAKVLASYVNNPFKPMKKGLANLVRGDVDPSSIDWDGLSITVLHPNTERLTKLQAQWDKELKKAKTKGDKTIITAALTADDTSVYNLSSIVCLVKYKTKTILLTGDARSDDITEGLKYHKLLDKDGKFHVDILKMPHHGSQRNVSLDFLQNITADNYVISADGNYDNPDKSTIEALAEVNKKNSNVTLYLTNHDGKKELKKKLDAVIAKMKKDKNKMKIVFKDDAEPSVLLNLLDKVEY